MALEHTPEMLKELQAMPLEAKVLMTKARIREFYTGYGSIKGYGNCYVSFSGGKDSTVLLHIARQLYPEIPAVFSNTGLEYPEIQAFVKRHENVTVVRPKMQFSEVISKYGYPLIGKEVAKAIYYARRIGNSKNYGRRTIVGEYETRGRGNAFDRRKWMPLATEIPVAISDYCCSVIKKRPIKQFQKKIQAYPIYATMAEESQLRLLGWLRTGCNSFDGNVHSKPMSFWTEQDVLRYIVQNDLEYASVYGDIVAVDDEGNEYDSHGMLMDGCKLRCTGCQRTGCIYCAFGAHLEKGETRFQRLARTHPRQYEYCMGGGQWVDNPTYDATAPEYDGEWKNWNPKKIWVPSKNGLGLKVVFDMVNEIYEKGFYRYD